MTSLPPEMEKIYLGELGDTLRRHIPPEPPLSIRSGDDASDARHRIVSVTTDKIWYLRHNHLWLGDLSTDLRLYI